MGLNDIKRVVRRTIENELYFHDRRLIFQGDRKTTDKYISKAKTAVSALRSLPDCDQFSDFSEDIAVDIIGDIVNGQ